MGKKLKFLFTSKCIGISLPQILPHMGKDLSFLPPKYLATLDHMEKESSFLPRSASFPCFPQKCNTTIPTNPLPPICREGFFPLQNAKPRKSFSTNFLYISLFSILFLFIYIIALNFLFYLFSKT